MAVVPPAKGSHFAIVVKKKERKKKERKTSVLQHGLLHVTFRWYWVLVLRNL